MDFVFYPSDTSMIKKFVILFKQNLEPISSTQQSLEIVHMPFEEEGHIRPIQCRKYIEYLKDILQKTQIASSFLTRDTSIPLVFYALRHKLLPRLYFIKELAIAIIRQLEQYRLYPLQTNTALRHGICVSYQRLLSALSEIEQQLQPLLDEALFQQRRMHTTLHYFSA